MKHLRKSCIKTAKVVVPLILAAVMVVALLATAIPAGGAAAEGDPEISITGAPPGECRILFDACHNNYWSLDDHKDFADIIGAQGYGIDELTTGPITSTILEQYCALMLSLPQTAYTSGEINAILDFVEGGGGLFVLGEWDDVRGTNTILNQITNAVGINLNSNTIYDTTNNHSGINYWPLIHQFASHNVTDGLGNLWYIAGCSIDVVDPAYQLGWGDDDSYSACPPATAAGELNAESAEEPVTEPQPANGVSPLESLACASGASATYEAPPLSDGDIEIAYDDGSSELGWTVSDIGLGSVFAVCFTPPEYPVKLKTARFFVVDYGVPTTPITIHVYEQASDSSPPGAELITPFTVTPPGPGWFDVDLSGYNIFINSGCFAIGEEPTVSESVYLGEDQSNPDYRSWFYDIVDEMWIRWVEELPGGIGDLMIRAVVTTGVVENPIAIAGSEYGNGRVVASGDSNLVTSRDTDGDLTTDIYQYDAAQFAAQVIEWLCQCVDPDIWVQPDSFFDVTLPPDTTWSDTLKIGNNGTATLTYSITDVETTAAVSPVSIPASDGNFPLGSAPTSTGPAPVAAAQMEGPAPGGFVVGSGEPAFAIDILPGENLVYIPDTTVPGTWNIVGSVAGTDYYAGDFLLGDFSQMYVLDYYTNTLYTLDTTTAISTPIGPCAPVSGQWTGMTGSANGTLYASSTDIATSYLYTINPATGVPTVVGQITNAPAIIDIAINAAGEMYGVDILNDMLVSIDPANGSGTVVGSIGFDANYAQGMDFEEVSGVLYLAACNGLSGAGELRIADTGLGNTTLVGSFSGGADTDCLGFTTFLPECPWLDENPKSGSVPPDKYDEITVEIDTTGLAVGDYSAEIRIANNDPDEDPTIVPVQLTVIAPKKPDLVIEQKWEVDAAPKKYLHPKEPLDPLRPIENPVCTYWHELYPVYCNQYHLSDWEDNGDKVLSPCDNIVLKDKKTGEEVLHHVDEMTVTIVALPEAAAGEDAQWQQAAAEEGYLEFVGGYEQVVKAMKDPVCTYWHIVWPMFCSDYHLTEWKDIDKNGVLSSGDQVYLKLTPEGQLLLCTLLEVTWDIVVSPVEEVSPCTYVVWYTVLNQGNDTAHAGHSATLYVDGVPVEAKVVPIDLEPEEKHTDSFRTVVECTTPGDLIEVCADNYRQVDELNEKNNCLQNEWPCPPSIDVEKKVWDTKNGMWVEEICALLDEIVTFNCTIHNDGCCDLTKIAVSDILSKSLRYANNATVNGEPWEPVEIGPNEFGWGFKGWLLEPCHIIEIEFDAIVVRWSAEPDVNTQMASAWCAETETGVNDEDTAAVQPFFPGDADMDGDVDVFDWVRVRRVLMGLDPPTCGADADTDGDVDVFDWVRVRRILMGL